MQVDAVGVVKGHAKHLADPTAQGGVLDLLEGGPDGDGDVLRHDKLGRGGVDAPGEEGAAGIGRHGDGGADLVVEGGPLVDADAVAGAAEGHGGAEPGDAGADNDDVEGHVWRFLIRASLGKKKGGRSLVGCNTFLGFSNRLAHPKCKKQRGGTDADAQEAGRAEHWKSKREGRDGCAWARAEALVRAARDSKLRRCLCQWVPVASGQWPVASG